MQVINHQDGKFSEAEMRGVPLRLEIGPKDIENNACVIAKRNDGTKEKYALDQELINTIETLLDTIHDEMYQKALNHRNSNIRQVNTYDEFKLHWKLKAVISK